MKRVWRCSSELENMPAGKFVLDWGEVVKRIRDKTKEGRELTYSEGAVGITALLYCPVKWELRQKYPEVESTAVEIDDGFLWEKQVKEVLCEMFGFCFEEEKVLELEVEGLKIEGHLDTFVEFEDQVIGIELKAPKMILLKKVPEYLSDNGLLIDDGTYTYQNPVYILQARIQKFLLQKLYPDKEVRQYIFSKALCKKGRWSKKLYVLYEVKDAISEEELRELVRKFKEDKSPRFPSECESYCEYYRQGLCEGRTPSFEDTSYEELDEETKNLLKDYRALEGELKGIESILKKRLKGSVRIGGKEVGWVRVRKVDLDKERVLFLLRREELSEYVLLDWRRKEELIERFGEEVIEREYTEVIWRL